MNIKKIRTIRNNINKTKTRPLLFGLDIDWCSIISVGIVNVLLKDCIEPQLKCPNSNITFWLYTRANQDNPHQLLANDPKSITSAPFVKNASIKILIHGYTGHKDYSPNTELRPAYMKCCNYNIISVDYNPIAREPCYIQAAHNMDLVGMCTAQLVDELVQKYGFDLSLIHPIGFSLGGQAAAFLAKYLKSGRFNRITGLDPAFPMFLTSDNNKKLDASDAKFVDVVHTNSFLRGKFEHVGTVDFFANDGITQPGCPTVTLTQSSCSHARAPAYFAESINTEIGFYAMRCTTWIDYMTGLCGVLSKFRRELLFGECVPLDSHGLYFFATNSKSPYAIGHDYKARTLTRNTDYFEEKPNEMPHKRLQEESQET